MRQAPLVSILIPCYNVSAYVDRAVQSVLSQDYQNLEIWLIDDASSDDTLSILNSFEDPRVRVVEFKENTQKIGAVNDVLLRVKGDLITFQDADDWSEPSRISKQVEKFSLDPNLGICFTNYKFFGKINYVPSKIALTNEELKDQFLNFWKNRNAFFYPTNCPSMMITRDVLINTKGYHEYFRGRVAEDIHWIYRILKVYNGITIEEPLYHYNIREDSFTNIQVTGKNAKYAYSWHLLSKIIHKDIYEGINVLEKENNCELIKLELLACEEALVERIVSSQKLKESYDKSMSYRLGKFLLKPLHIFKKCK
jgi:glycosyltransferase involved in cell wall biosynthesis